MGPLKLVANGDGISAVKFLFGRHGATWAAADVSTEGESVNEANIHLEACKKWLDAYFDGVLLGPQSPPRPKLVLPRKSECKNLLGKRRGWYVVPDCRQFYAHCVGDTC